MKISWGKTVVVVLVLAAIVSAQPAACPRCKRSDVCLCSKSVEPAHLYFSPRELNHALGSASAQSRFRIASANAAASAAAGQSGPGYVAVPVSICKHTGISNELRPAATVTTTSQGSSGLTYGPTFISNGQAPGPVTQMVVGPAYATSSAQAAAQASNAAAQSVATASSSAQGQLVPAGTQVFLPAPAPAPAPTQIILPPAPSQVLLSPAGQPQTQTMIGPVAAGPAPLMLSSGPAPLSYAPLYPGGTSVTSQQPTVFLQQQHQQQQQPGQVLYSMGSSASSEAAKASAAANAAGQLAAQAVQQASAAAQAAASASASASAPGGGGTVFIKPGSNSLCRIHSQGAAGSASGFTVPLYEKVIGPSGSANAWANAYGNDYYDGITPLCECDY